MRKEITIPDGMINDLKLVAADEKKSVKKLMEDVVIKHVTENSSRLKQAENAPEDQSAS